MFICWFVIFFFFIHYVILCIFFFFFQAEDGIRDWSVTGVQTCALPICEMPDDLVVIGVRRDDLEGFAAGHRHRTVVGRLAATPWIEAGAVERQRAPAHGRHARLGLEVVSRLQIEPNGARRYAGRPGAYLWPSASSHLR